MYNNKLRRFHNLATKVKVIQCLKGKYGFSMVLHDIPCSVYTTVQAMNMRHNSNSNNYEFSSIKRS